MYYSLPWNRSKAQFKTCKFSFMLDCCNAFSPNLVPSKLVGLQRAVDCEGWNTNPLKDIQLGKPSRLLELLIYKMITLLFLYFREHAYLRVCFDFFLTWSQRSHSDNQAAGKPSCLALQCLFSTLLHILSV